MTRDESPGNVSSGWLPPIFGFWVLMLGCTAMRNWDIWWHLRAGQLILEQGWVPQTDIFSYSSLDRPWIDLHWGFQLLVSGVFQLGGVTMLVLLKALCIATAVMIAWSAAGRDMPGWLKAVAWTLAVACLMSRSMIRPEMLSLIFLATWLWALHDEEHAHKRIWLLPFIQVVWVNCHGLFALGYAVGAAFVIGYIADRIRKPADSKSQLSALSLTIASALSLAACLLNPYFIRGALFPEVLYRKFSTDRVFYENLVTEFRSPLTLVERVGVFDHRIFPLILLAIAALSSFILVACYRRVHVMRLVLFVGFSYLAWQANRNANLFALVMGVVVCGNLCDFLRCRAASRGDSQIRQQPWLDRITAAAVVLAIVAGFAGYTWRGPIGRFYLGPIPGWYGYHAAVFAGKDGLPNRAFVSHFGQAALYLYHHGPDKKVFMDGRLEVASLETAEKYVQVKQAISASDPKFEDWIRDEEGRLPVIMLDYRRSMPLVRGMQQVEGWRLVYADDVAVVYTQDSTADEVGLKAVKLPAGLQQ